MRAALLSALLLGALALAAVPSSQAAALPAVPGPQCVMAPCGPQCLVACSPTDRLPDLPGLPSFPVCVTDPCPFIVCDTASDTVSVNGQTWRYDFTSNCGLVLTKTDSACPNGPYVQDAAVGGLVVRHAACSRTTVDPIAACAPPSGSTIERDILWIHVRLLVCDGGIPDRIELA